MKIIDPTDNQVYNLNSYKGKYILKQYIKFYQSGGHFVQVSQDMLQNVESFGEDSCAVNAFNWMGYGVIGKIFHILKVAGQSSEVRNNREQYGDYLTTENLKFFVNLIENAYRIIDKKIQNPNLKQIIHDTKQSVKIKKYRIKGCSDKAERAIRRIKEQIPKGCSAFLMIDWCEDEYDTDTDTSSSDSNVSKCKDGTDKCKEGDDSHIVCIVNDISNKLNLIELQGEAKIIKENNNQGQELQKYFETMYTCELIVGGLTLKSPPSSYLQKSNVNFPGKTSCALERIPIIRSSRRQTERRGIETQTVRQNMQLEEKTLRQKLDAIIFEMFEYMMIANKELIETSSSFDKLLKKQYEDDKNKPSNKLILKFSNKRSNESIKPTESDEPKKQLIDKFNKQLQNSEKVQEIVTSLNNIQQPQVAQSQVAQPQFAQSQVAQSQVAQSQFAQSQDMAPPQRRLKLTLSSAL